MEAPQWGARRGLAIHVRNHEPLVLDDISVPARADETVRVLAQRLNQLPSSDQRSWHLFHLGEKAWQYKQGSGLLDVGDGEHIIALDVAPGDFELLRFKVDADSRRVKVVVMSSLTFEDMAAMYRLWAGISDERAVTFMDMDRHEIFRGEEVLGAEVCNDCTLLVMSTAPGG